MVSYIKIIDKKTKQKQNGQKMYKTFTTKKSVHQNKPNQLNITNKIWKI